MIRSSPTWFVLLLLPRLGAASSVTEEVGAFGTEQTATNPQSSGLSDHISGLWTPSDEVDIHADVTGTLTSATKAQNGANFAGSGGSVWLAAIGLDWTPNEHWTLGGELEGSPSSTQTSDAPVSFVLADGSTAREDALVRSRSSSVGGTASIGFETAGDGNFETSINISATATHYDTVQTLSRLEGANGASNIDWLRAACVRYPRAMGCREFRSILAARPAQLNQWDASASLTETIFVDTDLGLSGTYYFYDQDPAAIGFFTVATLGRSKMQMGNGIQVAPYVYSLRPHLSHRFGPLLVDLSYQYARYVADTGNSNQVGLKLQYKFSKQWKAWLSGTGSSDASISSDGTQTTRSLTLGAGFKYTF